LNTYFASIDSKLAGYEWLQDALSLLELTIWKSKIQELYNPNNDSLGVNTKSECHINCGASVIIPNVLPFLLQD